MFHITALRWLGCVSWISGGKAEGGFLTSWSLETRQCRFISSMIFNLSYNRADIVSTSPQRGLMMKISHKNGLKEHHGTQLSSYKPENSISQSHTSCVAAHTSFKRHFGIFPCDNIYTEKINKIKTKQSRSADLYPTEARLNGPCTRTDNSSRAVGTNLVVD